MIGVEFVDHDTMAAVEQAAFRRELLVSGRRRRDPDVPPLVVRDGPGGRRAADLRDASPTSPAGPETDGVDRRHDVRLRRREDDGGLLGRALGYELEDEDGTARTCRPGGRGWSLARSSRRSVKNRLHLDLRPSDSMAAEVERVKALGASEFSSSRRAAASGP